MFALPISAAPSALAYSCFGDPRPYGRGYLMTVLRTSHTNASGRLLDRMIRQLCDYPQTPGQIRVDATRRLFGANATLKQCVQTEILICFPARVIFSARAQAL